MTHVNIIILNFNSGACLQRCVKCIETQSYKDWDLLVIDNASSDGSVEWIDAGRKDIRLIRNPNNVYFCEGFNEGIRQTTGDYVLVLNPDIFLQPDFLSHAVEALNDRPDAGGVQGKIWKIGNADSPIPDPGNRWIDTTGVLMTYSRRNFDRNQEQKDDGRFDTPGRIFGPDGCAPLYRRKMLDDIRIGNEYYDSDFLMYREVVDFNWRARAKGWIFIYEPAMTAFHVRGFSPATRSRQPSAFRRLSYRNRYLTLIKNETWNSLYPHTLRILGFEIAMLGHVVLREPFLLAAWLEIIMMLPKMMRKRKIIQSTRRVPPREITRDFEAKAPRLHFAK